MGSTDHVDSGVARGIDPSTIADAWDEIAMMFYMANWPFSTIELPSIRQVLRRLPYIGKLFALVVTSKTGTSIADIADEVINYVEDECEGSKVISLTTDNAKNMKKAWKVLERKRDIIFCTGCGAHTLNMLHKDVAKLRFVADIIEDANTLAVFIRSHTATSERLRADQAEHPTGSQRDLVLSVATRWYSNQDCIRNVLDNEAAIRRIMEDDVLLRPYQKAKVRKAKAIVNSGTFWRQGGVVLELLDPITQCIAHLENTLTLYLQCMSNSSALRITRFTMIDTLVFLHMFSNIFGGEFDHVGDLFTMIR
ncbi:unnamed protein product [Phytophthora fragariaefolia]|uniref:Unnamed protein product n=1 Tax=Phytophthora fragariaefolia TaxID=1490495 RepID=A0A9W7DAU2_9STRA|nr:unnamed protein product [Phytophthora fragariaefolia]